MTTNVNQIDLLCFKGKIKNKLFNLNLTGKENIDFECWNNRRFLLKMYWHYSKNNIKYWTGFGELPIVAKKIGVILNKRTWVNLVTFVLLFFAAKLK